jgi:hypothetical protein
MNFTAQCYGNEYTANRARQILAKIPIEQPHSQFVRDLISAVDIESLKDKREEILRAIENGRTTNSEWLDLATAKASRRAQQTILKGGYKFPAPKDIVLGVKEFEAELRSLLLDIII